jgi:hypothetical protein
MRILHGSLLVPIRPAISLLAWSIIHDSAFTKG